MKIRKSQNPNPNPRSCLPLSPSPSLLESHCRRWISHGRIRGRWIHPSATSRHHSNSLQSLPSPAASGSAMAGSTANGSAVLWPLVARIEEDDGEREERRWDPSGRRPSPPPPKLAAATAVSVVGSGPPVVEPAVTLKPAAVACGRYRPQVLLPSQPPPARARRHLSRPPVLLLNPAVAAPDRSQAHRRSAVWMRKRWGSCREDKERMREEWIRIK